MTELPMERGNAAPKGSVPELVSSGRGTPPAVGRDSLFADVFARGTAFRNYDVFPNGELAVVERSPGGERLIGMTNWTVRLRR